MRTHNTALHLCISGLIFLSVIFSAALPASGRSTSGEIKEEKAAVSKVTQLLVEALFHDEAANHKAAEKTLHNALRIRPDYIPTLIALGKHYARQGGTVEQDYLAKAASLIEQGTSTEAEDRLALGQAYLAAAQSISAAEQFDASIKVAQRKGQPLLEARALIAFGKLHTDNSEFKAAEKTLLDASVILGRHSKRDIIPTRRLWLLAIAEFHESRGALDEATDALLILAQLSVDVKDHAMLSKRLGEIAAGSGDCALAQDYFKQALRLTHEGYGEEHPKTSGARDQLRKFLALSSCI